jgi:predicted Zn-dependent peptidase
MGFIWRGFLLALLCLASCLGVVFGLPREAMARDLPVASPSLQPYFDRVSSQVTEFRLSNGMTFIVLERHQAPIVSFLTYADVGGVDEPEGKTGVAHFLEHMAFKGTRRIGATAIDKELRLLALLDQLDAQIRAAKRTGDRATVTKLEAEFGRVQADASRLVKQNEFGQIVERYGGVGLNATTSTDATKYFFSFPSNKLELWMSLESERFLEPVFREFYEEKSVILEERRMRVDNSPVGQLLEAVLDTAFQQHPYRRPVIGYQQDIENLTRQDVQDFFQTYYVPSQLTIAIVGDVIPQRVQQLAELYFGRYPTKAAPPKVSIVEPEQTASRAVTLTLPTQPVYVEGYHRPAMNHPDHVVYELLSAILSNGRTSRLYSKLVEQQRIALYAQGFSGFPGDKFPNLLMFYALTAPGHTIDQLSAALSAELERLQQEPVSDAELLRVKTQARANLLRSLDSNMGMAQLLLEYQVKTGSWRNLFQEVAAIDAVTASDIQRVARATFRPENRTIGKLLPQ